MSCTFLCQSSSQQYCVSPEPAKLTPSFDSNGLVMIIMEGQQGWICLLLCCIDRKWQKQWLTHRADTFTSCIRFLHGALDHDEGRLETQVLNLGIDFSGAFDFHLLIRPASKIRGILIRIVALQWLYPCIEKIARPRDYSKTCWIQSSNLSPLIASTSMRGWKYRGEQVTLSPQV